MFNEVNDKVLLQKVNQRLGRAGTGGKSRVVATARKGEITLSGTLQYETQRRPLVKIASAVEGVRRVVDQLRVEAKKDPHGHG